MPYRPYGGPAPNSGPLVDVGSTIRDIAQDFATAFNTGNYDQCAAQFAPDGYFMPPHHQTVQGNKAIERSFREFADEGYQDLRLESQRVDSSGDMAVEIGRYTVSIRQANGSMVVDRGKYLNAWRRFGVWLRIADCWSSDLPAIVPQQTQGKQLPDSQDDPIISPDVERSA
ncbi:MAG: hypothetical protein DMG68_06220 [Acidobacteria bacterium]|jgi:uncharacterized protein (TIGR02246 family)|nr:MAG: hypothetical protein DMG68_06220 [Acidobacteriota bacterium]